MKDHVYKSKIKAMSHDNVLQFTERNPFHGYQDIIKSLNKMETELLPAGGIFDATKIPYTRSLYGDILMNNTSVSILDSNKMTYADSVCYSCTKQLGIAITSRIKRYRHKNPEIEAHINYSLNNLKIGKRKFFDALMTSIWAGFSANYLVWGHYKGRFIINDVIPMPPTSIIMSVDNNGTLKGYGGIMQYYYNTNLSGWANPFTYGAEQGDASPQSPRGDYPIPLRVPYINPMYLKPFHQKDILLHTISGTDGATNPYGRMMSRAAWPKYLYKEGFLQNMMIAATYKAAPLLLFYTDSTRPIQDINGNTYSIADDLTNKLNNYDGNGFLIINGKLGETAQHAVVDNTAKLDDFQIGIDMLNNEIRTSYLTPGTMFESEGNYATSMSHNSNYGKITASLCDDLCETLLTQFVKPQIAYNWYEDDLGYFELQELTIDDKLKIAKLMEFGYGYNVLCQDETKPEQFLADLNMCRRQMEWDTTDDIFINPELESQGTNFSDTQRMAGTPHADGLNNYGRKFNEVKGK